ncbi:MAG: hypothetical protein IJC27_09455 [Lentisphaeria bacterium]|nr:hypothetical protein [Lentisphaeria bacterium]
MGWDYLLLPLLGLVWAAVGVVVANARAQGVSIFHFFLLGTVCASLIFLGINLVCGMEDIFAPGYRTALLCFAGGSLLNSLGQAVAMYNLKQGGRALAFAIPQLAFVLPYIWSIVFWGEKLTIASGAGLLLIAGAVCFLSLKKSADSGATGATLSAKRLMTAFAAMLIIGSSQIATSVPAQLEKSQQLSSMTGAMIIQFAAVVLFAVFSFFSPVKFADAVKKCWKNSIYWGIGAVASYCILLPALYLMSERNQSGIVYPVGCSSLILLFALYAALKYREKLSLSQSAAFVAIVAGIFLVRM